jgi:hypothetical protein
VQLHWLAGLAALRSLTCFCARGNGITAAAWPVLCPGLARHTGLLELGLGGQEPWEGRGDSRAVSALGTMLARLERLRTLDLQGMLSGDGDVRALLTHLAPLSYLKTVDKQICGVGFEYAQSLREQLKACTWMQCHGVDPFWEDESSGSVED